MPKSIIDVKGLSKSYKIEGKQAQYLSIRDSLTNLGKRMIGQSKETFWALHDINFEVEKGECLGIIGSNGAGKSTLLKILSRITPPTTGSVTMRGRVASLLEVGTGFHPELTGRENIFLNGSILGMGRQEINTQLDEIIHFSGVEKFLETPLKHYSSGMQLRLAFAVAAHLSPEILLIDEILAVGDAEFQKRCLGKMDEVSKSGRTVIFVSHDLGAVGRLCKKTLFLNKGRKMALGETSSIINDYLSQTNAIRNSLWNTVKKDNETVKIIAAEVSFIDNSKKTIIVKTTIQADSYKPNAFIAFDISTMGTTVMQAIPQNEPFISLREGLVEIQVSIDVDRLIPNTYDLSIWIGSSYEETYDWEREILSFTLLESPVHGRLYPHNREHGYFVANSNII